MATHDRTGDDIIVSLTVDVVLSRLKFDLAEDGFVLAQDYADELADAAADLLRKVGGMHTAGVRVEAKAGPRTEPAADGRPTLKPRDTYGRQYLYNRDNLFKETA